MVCILFYRIRFEFAVRSPWKVLQWHAMICNVLYDEGTLLFFQDVMEKSNCRNNISRIRKIVIMYCFGYTTR